MKKARFYSCWAVSDINTPHNIISISEGKAVAQLNDCHSNVLRLYFHDITEPITDDPFHDYVIFSDEQADSILDWLANLENPELVIVHCSAGVSRSPAVVLFMMDYLDYELDIDIFCKDNFSLMNPHVYDTLVKRYKIRSDLQ